MTQAELRPETPPHRGETSPEEEDQEVPKRLITEARTSAATLE